MRQQEYRSVAMGGEAGTGKTTIATLLATNLGWGIYGAGNEFRTARPGKPDHLIGAASGSDSEHDKIDDHMVQLLSEGGYVVEGRVAGLVAAVRQIPDVMKVLLVCGDVRFQRIFDRNPGKYPSVEQARAQTLQREEENLVVFSNRYGGRSYLDHSNYDLVIDTGAYEISQIVHSLLGQINS